MVLYRNASNHVFPNVLLLCSMRCNSVPISLLCVDSARVCCIALHISAVAIAPLDLSRLGSLLSSFYRICMVLLGLRTALDVLLLFHLQLYMDAWHLVLRIGIRQQWVGELASPRLLYSMHPFAVEVGFDTLLIAAFASLQLRMVLLCLVGLQELHQLLRRPAPCLGC